jgi:hypothetical protein
MPHGPTVPLGELVDMTFRLMFSVWLVCASFVQAQEAPKGHGRFFNDSAKAVDLYIEGQFACSVSANPEGNNAYCDAEIGYGKHTLSARGPRLPRQSCDVFVGEGTHAEANLSKGERLHCSTVRGEME